MNCNIDYYEILEVHPKASQEIIKKAYQTLAKKYHPDTTTLGRDAANKKMALLNEAFQILSNANLRSQYDVSISRKEPVSNHRNISDEDNIIFSPSGSFIMNLCEETLKKIDGNIICKDGFEKQNFDLCEEYATYFMSNIESPLKVVKTLQGNKKELYSFITLTYWRIASAYTWAQDFLNAEYFINKASEFIDQNDDFYDKFSQSLLSIRKNASLQKEVEQKNHSAYTPSLLGRMIAIFVVGLIIYGMVSNQPHSSSTKPAVSPKQTQAATPVSKNEKPIAKSGITTQYDKNHKILNNNGYCELTIDNTNNNMPVYVRVWDLSNNIPVRAFTIRQGEIFKATNISPGNYEVRYKELYENNIPLSGAKSEPILLVQRQTLDGTEYSQVSLTLYKVRNGNTQTYQIPTEQI